MKRRLIGGYIALIALTMLSALQVAFAEQPTVARVSVEVRDRAWLGVTIVDLDDEAAAQLGLNDLRGARIIAIKPNAPAAQSGLEMGDVLISIDNITIVDGRHFVEFLQTRKPGTAIELVIRRKQAEHRLQVQLAATPFRDAWRAALRELPADQQISVVRAALNQEHSAEATIQRASLELPAASLWYDLGLAYGRLPSAREQHNVEAAITAFRRAMELTRIMHQGQRCAA